MKELKSSINEIVFETFMEDIDASLINESLQCSYLLAIAKQLKPFGAKNGGNYWNNRSFSGLFGSLPIAWDQIKDSDFQKYEAGDKEGIKRARAILSNSNGYVPGILLFPNADGETFDAMVSWRGYVNFKDQKWDYETKSYKEGPSNGPEEYKQKWLKEDCEKRSFYILDYSKFEISSKITDRRNAKEGSFTPGDMYYYQRVAADNVERYRKILAKRKAEKAAKEDTIAQQVEEIVNKVMTMTTTAAKDPDKYVDVQWEISRLVESIYETTRWDSRKGKTYGQNGLLYLFNNYLKTHLSMAKNGGSTYDEKSNAARKTDIEKKINDINDAIARIEQKLK